MGVEATEALEHAHSLSILHRDIKPGNLLIDQEGKLWITDFGLARLPTDAGLTMTGGRAGDAAVYFARTREGPAWAGGSPHGHYLLGATLYELLTGPPVVQGIAWPQSSKVAGIVVWRTIRP